MRRTSCLLGIGALGFALGFGASYTPSRTSSIPLRESSSPSVFSIPSLQPTSEQAVPHEDYRVTDFSQDSDEVLLARMIWGEARGCSETERRAVGYTAVNRARDGKRWNGETVRDALLTKSQYECFDEANVNRAKLMDPCAYEPKTFKECLLVARDILNGTANDPTQGATHYFNPTVVQPSWAHKLEHIGRISTETGASVHDFYREE